MHLTVTLDLRRPLRAVVEISRDRYLMHGRSKTTQKLNSQEKCKSLSGNCLQIGGDCIVPLVTARYWVPGISSNPAQSGLTRIFHYFLSHLHESGARRANMRLELQDAEEESAYSIAP